MAAFRTAADAGADVIELNAKLSMDGHVMGVHDATVRPTTRREGRVAEKPVSGLRVSDVGSHFSRQYVDERISFPEEGFEAFQAGPRIKVQLIGSPTRSDEWRCACAD